MEPIVWICTSEREGVEVRLDAKSGFVQKEIKMETKLRLKEYAHR